MSDMDDDGMGGGAAVATDSRFSERGLTPGPGPLLRPPDQAMLQRIFALKYGGEEQ